MIGPMLEHNVIFMPPNFVTNPFPLVTFAPHNTQERDKIRAPK